MRKFFICYIKMPFRTATSIVINPLYQNILYNDFVADDRLFVRRVNTNQIPPFATCSYVASASGKIILKTEGFYQDYCGENEQPIGEFAPPYCFSVVISNGNLLQIVGVDSSDNVFAVTDPVNYNLAQAQYTSFSVDLNVFGVCATAVGNAVITPNNQNGVTTFSITGLPNVSPMPDVEFGDGAQSTGSVDIFAAETVLHHLPDGTTSQGSQFTKIVHTDYLFQLGEAFSNKEGCFPHICLFTIQK